MTFSLSLARAEAKVRKVAKGRNRTKCRKLQSLSKW